MSSSYLLRRSAAPFGAPSLLELCGPPPFHGLVGLHLRLSVRA
jgi:hypothetical protein